MMHPEYMWRVPSKQWLAWGMRKRATRRVEHTFDGIKLAGYTAVIVGDTMAYCHDDGSVFVFGAL